jgi:Sulfatase-modifying factor enzyme 1
MSRTERRRSKLESAARIGSVVAALAGPHARSGRGWRANSWQGLFPLQDGAHDGYSGTAPVGCFAPNGYRLFDMAVTSGNTRATGKWRAIRRRRQPTQRGRIWHSLPVPQARPARRL